MGGLLKRGLDGTDLIHVIVQQYTSYFSESKIYVIVKRKMKSLYE